MFTFVIDHCTIIQIIFIVFCLLSTGMIALFYIIHNKLSSSTQLKNDHILVVRANAIKNYKIYFYDIINYSIFFVFSVVFFLYFLR